jgi:hypothetical protein
VLLCPAHHIPQDFAVLISCGNEYTKSPAHTVFSSLLLPFNYALEGLRKTARNELWWCLLALTNARLYISYVQNYATFTEYYFIYKNQSQNSCTELYYIKHNTMSRMKWWLLHHVKQVLHKHLHNDRTENGWILPHQLNRKENSHRKRHETTLGSFTSQIDYCTRSYATLQGSIRPFYVPGPSPTKHKSDRTSCFYLKCENYTHAYHTARTRRKYNVTQT